MSKLKKLIKGIGAGAGVGFLAGLAMSGYGKSQASKKAPTSSISKKPKSKIVKDPTTEGLRITRSKPFAAEDTADPTASGLAITRSRPFAAEDVAMPRTPVGFEYEQGIEGTFGPMAKKGKFIKVKKAEEGKIITTGRDRLTGKDIEIAGDIEGARAPYLKKRDKDRLTNKDLEKAQKDFYKQRNKELPGTEGSFMGGGSVVARGDKFSRNRSRPTKLS